MDTPGQALVENVEPAGPRTAYFRAAKAGASAYLLKGMLLEHMLNVIRSVHAGLQSWPPERDLSNGSRKDDLTPRECDIIRLVGCGSSNREIAHELGIGEETVKTSCAISC